jgi:hypothetical protein
MEVEGEAEEEREADGKEGSGYTKIYTAWAIEQMGGKMWTQRLRWHENSKEKWRTRSPTKRGLQHLLQRTLQKNTYSTSIPDSIAPQPRYKEIWWCHWVSEVHKTHEAANEWWDLIKEIGYHG